ncbi:MBL fold metallo-hydrolase [Virgibacillus flavescens]|uniref:MBL fold metallo-hydrolase n=1 Tax=Virgibacillus flavescens TaxID=1611422 RepID=UPI003D330CAF
MKIESMSLGPLGTNCYIIYNGEDALIIDPGGDEEVVVEFLKDKSCTPKAILLTHAHFDHIGAVDYLRKEYNIEVYLHQNEKEWLSEPNLNGSISFTQNPISIEPPEKELSEGYLQIESFSFEVLFTPGHSPGSVCFVFEDLGFVIGGDVLFKHGVGRTDLPGGSMEVLMESISEKLYKLNDSMIVYPGHGPSTTISNEKRVNPFVKG